MHRRSKQHRGLLITTGYRAAPGLFFSLVNFVNLSPHQLQRPHQHGLIESLLQLQVRDHKTLADVVEGILLIRVHHGLDRRSSDCPSSSTLNQEAAYWVSPTTLQPVPSDRSGEVPPNSVSMHKVDVKFWLDQLPEAVSFRATCSVINSESICGITIACILSTTLMVRTLPGGTTF